MPKSTSSVLALVGAAALSGVAYTQVPVVPVDVVAHEWGTFTTIADDQGKPSEWLPLSGEQDLPCFIQKFGILYKDVIYEGHPPLVYETARGALRGRVRMETPVIYFYANQPATVDVNVTFPHGLVTEWFPAATVTQPTAYRDSLSAPTTTSSIRWKHVEINPQGSTNYPQGMTKSHYYAARATDATPLRVAGGDEKFLFYRGVGNFNVPITAIALDDGTVGVRNVGGDPIATVILFESRGGKLGYTTTSTVDAGVTMKRPELTKSFADLRGELERALVASGLYQKEATAMVDTWRESWFEEGLRVFYVMPQAAVDTVLPLTITPQASQVVRTFVGRVEMITAEDERAMANAIAANDRGALDRMGRWLSPVIDRLVAAAPNEVERQKILSVANASLARYVSGAGGCR